MTEDEYEAAVQQIAADHACLERVRRFAEGLISNPAGIEPHELCSELAEIVGIELPAELAEDNATDRAHDEYIDRRAGVSW